MLCTQVPYWIHWAAQFFWCSDKTPSANSSLYHPDLETSRVLQKGEGWRQVETPKHYSLCTSQLCITAQGFFLHRHSSPFHVIFLTVSENKIFYIRTGHVCAGRNVREDARCLFPTNPALPKYSSHSLAGTCRLWGHCRVCWNDPPNSSIRPMWFGESSKYGA